MKLPLPLALLVAAAAATSVPDCTSSDDIISSDDGVFAFKCVKLASGAFAKKFHGCYMKDSNLKDTLILKGRRGYANGNGVERFGFRKLCQENKGRVKTTTDGCYVTDKNTGQLRDLEVGDSTTYEDNENVKLMLECFRDPVDKEVRARYSIAGAK